MGTKKRNSFFLSPFFLAIVCALLAAAPASHAGEREVDLLCEAAAESLVKAGIDTIERAGRTFSLLGEMVKSEQRAADAVRDGKAGEDRVIALLNEGSLADASAMLAQLARLPTANVVSALSAARVDPLLIVLKLANFSWSGVHQVLDHKAGGPTPVKLLADARRSYDDLSKSNAERALRLIAIKRTVSAR